jgi:hypothetical protein
MRLSVARVDELSHDLEACLLERPERGGVSHVGIGDARGCRWAREDDLVNEAPQHIAAYASPRQRRIGDEEVDTSDADVEPDQLGVVWMVGDEVRLEEPDWLLFEHDEVEVGRSRPFNSGEVSVDDLFERLAAAPPLAYVRTLEPLVHQRQIVTRHCAKPSHASGHSHVSKIG